MRLIDADKLLARLNHDMDWNRARNNEERIFHLLSFIVDVEQSDTIDKSKDITINLNKKLLAHEVGHAPIEIDGFKLIEPDGVTLFIGKMTRTMPRSEVQIIQEASK